MGDDRKRSSLPPELVTPHPGRCDPRRPDYAEIRARHAAALEAGEPTYIDPATGFQAWTAAALWEMGFCCESGCRHCPYVKR